MSPAILHIVVLLIAVAGCTTDRARAAPAPLVTWNDDVEAIVGARCASCHMGTAAAAGYDLTSYLGALGNGLDATANAIAGDEQSIILSKLEDEVHAGLADVIPLLRAWVVDSRLAYSRSRIHEPGLLNPADSQFHGAELARHDWDLGLCAKCHGADFSGGAAKATCNSCHAGGPTACATCHRDGPTTGAHQIHREIGKLDCAECHIKPSSWDAEGHLFHDGVVDPAPAEVTFGARAGLTPVAADRHGSPAFVDGRCTNVYCHGDALHAAGGTAPQPRWDDATPAGGCATCHGAPPPSHASNQCASCHPASAPHIDGVVQGGSTTGCDGCHGSAASPAPPRDLAGNTFTTALGVGAHQAHLQAPSGLRGPIACATCHLVPAQIGDAGHIDSALPAEVDAGLGWNRDTATCTTAFCHGPSTPKWTLTGVVACGTCHGIPPASHAPNLPITSCATCHPRTIDSTGTILITAGPLGPTSEHIDGDVDLL